jgi:hypothetical protein
MAREALEAGERRAASFYPSAHVVEFASEDVLRIDPRGGSFVNVNTPDELVSVEERMLRGEFPERSSSQRPTSARDFCELGEMRMSCGCAPSIVVIPPKQRHHARRQHVAADTCAPYRATKA